ncbi:MAG: hypothetical protein POELPBGB_03596 [Bacteroidia bacterium]|nr:hypothetical protein [Bacteroidia bacterium]
MQENPFTIIEKQLQKIEELLSYLINKKSTSTAPVGEFRFMPIQEIFKKKICSKPTFYAHLKAGNFRLFKFGNKSFVDKNEFLSTFHSIKFKKNT